ncbi:hypothetical protein L6Q79_09230 [bacterium]|nr:hypothetical protein [bacterium]NUN45190.1 hypothetical protein [bacterium]
MEFHDLNLEEIENLTKDELRIASLEMDSEINDLEVLLVSTTITTNFCSLYRPKMRKTLKRILNIISHPILKAIIGSKPSKALKKIIEILDKVCP